MDEPLFNELLESTKQADRIMQITKLKELAERASAGDWSYSPCMADKHFLGQVWNGSGESLCIMDHMNEQANADGAFIAAANPQAILGLIERLEKAEQHWANENSNNMALIAEVERLRSQVGALARGAEQAMEERDRLKTENETLQAALVEAIRVVAKTDPEGTATWLSALEGGGR